MNIKGFELEMTCGACPEQYDVYLCGENVAYLRLRHGYFYAQCPIGGEVVYQTHPRNSDGIFSYEDRAEHLPRAINAVINYYLEQDKIELAGCHDCKNERYVLKEQYFAKCPECSPYHCKFHYVKN